MFSKDQWIELEELMLILGYSDERSSLKWCKDQGIPVVKLGLKKYISSQLLTQYIDNQLVIFVKGTKVSKTKSSAQFVPDSEIVSKYLEKFKSNDSIRPSKKR